MSLPKLSVFKVYQGLIEPFDKFPIGWQLTVKLFHQTIVGLIVTVVIPIRLEQLLNLLLLIELLANQANQVAFDEGEVIIWL